MGMEPVFTISIFWRVSQSELRMRTAYRELSGALMRGASPSP